MVTGASMSAPIALATANRSPEGSPASVSGPASPTSPSASSDRSIAASCAQDAPRVRLSSATPVSSTAAVTAAVTVTGARTTSPAASWRARLRSWRATSSGSARPTPEHQGVLRERGLVEGSWMATPADAAGAVGVPEDEVQERVAQVVEDAAEAGVRAKVHRNEHLPKLGATPSA